MLDLDLVLVILRHLSVFGLFAVLIAELVVVGRGMSTAVVACEAATDIILTEEIFAKVFDSSELHMHNNKPAFI